jgi:hypothetical protein
MFERNWPEVQNVDACPFSIDAKLIHQARKIPMRFRDFVVEREPGSAISGSHGFGPLY